MDDAAREALSKRLGEMKVRQAMRELRSMDPDSNMVFWRNSMWDEFLTLFLLPNVGVEVTLVEKRNDTASEHEIGGGPTGYKAHDEDYEYVEARVESLSRPARKRGGFGPAPLKRIVEQEG